jgi:hypothetical protein
MAYPGAMETLPALSHEVWERTPPEAQAYMRVLEARVETLASMVHTCQEQVRTFQEQLNQTSRHSSRPPSSAPPSFTHVHLGLGVNAVVVVNRAIPARRAPWCLWKLLRRWSSSNPSSVAGATRP